MLTAAFYWNGTDKTISFMILDEHFDIVYPARSLSLNFDDREIFAKEAHLALNQFFSAITQISSSHDWEKMNIEYKIIRHLTPIVRYFSEMNEPSFEALFIKNTFMSTILTISHAHSHITLSKQYQKKLTGDALKLFKKTLNDLHLVKKVRGNSYEYHLWAIALHVTLSNCDTIVKKLITVRNSHEGKIKRK